MLEHLNMLTMGGSKFTFPIKGTSTESPYTTYTASGLQPSMYKSRRDLYVIVVNQLWGLFAV